MAGWCLRTPKEVSLFFFWMVLGKWYFSEWLGISSDRKEIRRDQWYPKLPDRTTREDFEFLLFSHSVVSNSLRPHGLQHTRLPFPSPTPGVCSNSCPSRRWCHPTILSSVVPFSSRLQSFPASGSSPMSWLFTSGGKILELQLQHQSFQWIFKVDFL